MESNLEAKFAHAEIETNAAGAKQSRLNVRYDLLSPVAMEQLAHVNWYGSERYGVNNWHGIPVESHINHAIYHFYKYLAGDRNENHLSHAFCRAMMALDRDEAAKVPQEAEAIGERLYTKDDILATMTNLDWSAGTADVFMDALERAHADNR